MLSKRNKKKPSWIGILVKIKRILHFSAMNQCIPTGPMLDAHTHTCTHGTCHSIRSFCLCQSDLKMTLGKKNKLPGHATDWIVNCSLKGCHIYTTKIMKNTCELAHNMSLTPLLKQALSNWSATEQIELRKPLMHYLTL